MKEIQRARFEELRQMVESQGIDLVKVLAQILKLSPSTVYRRLDGSTLLDLDGIHKIQQYFQLPADFFTRYHSPYITFHFQPLRAQPDSVQSFLKPIQDKLNTLIHLPQPHIFYSSSEIPFLHYFHLPELAYFKFYLWASTVWKIPALMDLDFDRKMIRTFDDQGLPHQLKEMISTYQSIPSSEFWTVNILDNTMNQIRFQYETRRIPDLDVALGLMDNLRELIRILEKQANEGYKVGTQTPFALHHNEITHTNNTILIEAHNKPLGVFVTYDNPNFMFTKDPTITNYTRRWFEKLEEGSTYITRTGARQRTRYFSDLAERWDTARARLK